MAASGIVKNLSQKWGTLEAENAKMFENAVAVACLAYVTCALVGGFWNRKLSLKLKKMFNSMMAEQFSQVGVQNEGGAMLVDGLSTAYMYGTGRKNVKYMKVCLEMRKRQDLFSVGRELLFGFSGDRAKVIMPFSVALEPTILVIYKRKQVKMLLEENEDLNTYGKSLAWPAGTAAPEALDLLGENADAAQTLLSASMMKVITQFEKNIVSIHISDHGLAEQQAGEEKSVVVFDLVVPRNDDDMRQLLFQFPLALADRVASMNLTPVTREAVKTQRKAIDDILYKEKEKERQEEAQRKKIEKKQKEKEDRAGKSREAQRKAEEKEAKRDSKKRMRGMMKVAK